MANDIRRQTRAKPTTPKVPPIDRERIVRVATALGANRAAQELGVSRNALCSYLSGLPNQHAGTLALLALNLDDAERALVGGAA